MICPPVLLTKNNSTSVSCFHDKKFDYRLNIFVEISVGIYDLVHSYVIMLLLQKKFSLIEYHLGRQYSVSFWYIRFEQRW